MPLLLLLLLLLLMMIMMFLLLFLFLLVDSIGVYWCSPAIVSKTLVLTLCTNDWFPSSPMGCSGDVCGRPIASWRSRGGTPTAEVIQKTSRD